MPTISRFYGLIIRMYYLSAEHNPPHIHVIYGEYSAAIEISTREILSGNLPAKALSIAREWVAIHQDELEEMWETQRFKYIDPLE